MKSSKDNQLNLKINSKTISEGRLKHGWYDLVFQNLLKAEQAGFVPVEGMRLYLGLAPNTMTYSNLTKMV